MLVTDGSVSYEKQQLDPSVSISVQSAKLLLHGCIMYYVKHAVASVSNEDNTNK